MQQGETKPSLSHRLYHELECSLAGHVEIETIEKKKGVSGSKTYALVAVHKWMIVDQ